jgi:Protein of unknown function (DUF3445)
MDRYFKNVEVGMYVKRVNWSVSMSAELFQPGLGSNHAQKGEEVLEFKGELDPEQVSRWIDSSWWNCPALCFRALLRHRWMWGS